MFTFLSTTLISKILTNYNLTQCAVSIPVIGEGTEAQIVDNGLVPPVGIEFFLRY